MGGEIVAMMAVGIPLAAVIGKTIVQPLINAWRPAGGDNSRVVMLEQRVALLERNQEQMEKSMTRLVEEADFLRQLQAPPPSSTPPPLPPSGPLPPQG